MPVPKQEEQVVPEVQVWNERGESWRKDRERGFGVRERAVVVVVKRRRRRGAAAERCILTASSRRASNFWEIDTDVDVCGRSDDMVDGCGR